MHIVVRLGDYMPFFTDERRDHASFGVERARERPERGAECALGRCVSGARGDVEQRIDVVRTVGARVGLGVAGARLGRTFGGSHTTT